MDEVYTLLYNFQIPFISLGVSCMNVKTLKREYKRSSNRLIGIHPNSKANVGLSF